MLRDGVTDDLNRWELLGPLLSHPPVLQGRQAAVVNEQDQAPVVASPIDDSLYRLAADHSSPREGLVHRQVDDHRLASALHGARLSAQFRCAREVHG